MHPSHFAKSQPDKIALIMADTGEQLTYAELEAAATQAAHLYRSSGLRRGDTVAILAHNCIDYYVAWWGAQRAGLYFNCLPIDSTADDTAYVVNDCAASVLIVSGVLGEAARQLVQTASSSTPCVRAIYTLHWNSRDGQDWRKAIAVMPSTPLADRSAGNILAYSSGSTGRPKGIRHPLPSTAFDARDPLTDLWVQRFGYRNDSVYIAPGPLWHSFTLVCAAMAQRVGATIVQMSRFDPQRFFTLVEEYRASVAQMVPMMFVRLLKLPAAEREPFDVSSLRSIVHAGAPCAPAIKRAMIDWWGPILHDLYSGTEGVGAAIISSQEWLERPGSVGKPAWGRPHICGDDGGELDPGQTGAIYFEGPSQVQILNDPARTEAMRHPVHKTWATYGDVGRVDADGYLYVTDRAAFVVQCGEHRLYPQETEDVLIAHPRVADVAVFGVSDLKQGTQLKAVVQTLKQREAGPELAEELSHWCRANLSAEQCPAIIAFTQALPRKENGKLNKARLRDNYADNATES